VSITSWHCASVCGLAGGSSGVGDGGGFIGPDSPAWLECCLRGLQRVDRLGGRVKEGGVNTYTATITLSFNIAKY
jgi:hypothetical protein